MDVEEEASAYDMEPVSSHVDACISSLPLSTPSILQREKERGGTGGGKGGGGRGGGRRVESVHLKEGRGPGKGERGRKREGGLESLLVWNMEGTRARTCTHTYTHTHCEYGRWRVHVTVGAKPMCHLTVGT
jgi:hypothetical protein